MSDLQKKTAKLIAEAEALLSKARADVQHTREVLKERGGDPAERRASLERRLGPAGTRSFDDLVAQRLATLRAQVGRDIPSPEVAEPSPGLRRRRPRNMV